MHPLALPSRATVAVRAGLVRDGLQTLQPLVQVTVRHGHRTPARHPCDP
jgi:hypothetical protein